MFSVGMHHALRLFFQFIDCSGNVGAAAPLDVLVASSTALGAIVPCFDSTLTSPR